MTSTEPELAVRADGRVLAPRLADATAAVPEPEVTSFEAGKMVENGRKLQGKNKQIWNDEWNGEQYRSMIYTFGRLGNSNWKVQLSFSAFGI